MSLSLYLQPGTPPDGGLPGNRQALVDFVSQYVLIAGIGSVGFINFGADTPSPENRTYPWWRIDATGNPMGMYSWNGSAWVTTSQVISNGPTANRPLNPTVGTQYFDTTISRSLIYERGQWRTADGGIGEIREFEGASLAAVLAMNPGWIEHSVSAGRVIASPNTDHAYGSLAGEDSTTLGINQIPAHTHTVSGNYGSGGEGAGENPLYYDLAKGPVSLQAWPDTGTAGGSQAHNSIQPTMYLWRLLKT